jgi:hypothetical protein
MNIFDTDIVEEIMEYHSTNVALEKRKRKGKDFARCQRKGQHSRHCKQWLYAAIHSFFFLPGTLSFLINCINCIELPIRLK